MTQTTKPSPVDRMLKTHYSDYLRTRLSPVTGKPVWPIERSSGNGPQLLEAMQRNAA